MFRLYAGCWTGAGRSIWCTQCGGLADTINCQSHACWRCCVAGTPSTIKFEKQIANKPKSTSSVSTWKRLHHTILWRPVPESITQRSIGHPFWRKLAYKRRISRESRSLESEHYTRICQTSVSLKHHCSFMPLKIAKALREAHDSVRGFGLSNSNAICYMEAIIIVVGCILAGCPCECCKQCGIWGEYFWRGWWRNNSPTGW